MSSQTNVLEGVQPAYAAYIPARTAILPCMSWPRSLTFPALKLSNASPEEVTALCQSFDEFVLRGFDQQPFMQGMTPKLVQRLVEQAQAQNPQFIPIHLAINNFWTMKSSCYFCRSIRDFYVQGGPSDSSEWRRWLQQFSDANRHADALLAPVLIHSYSDAINDRGLIIARRTASVGLLLISTLDGNLIWAREREAQAFREKLQTDPAASSLTSPPLEALKERLLTQDLWLNFPGRKN